MWKVLIMSIGDVNKQSNCIRWCESLYVRNSAARNELRLFRWRDCARAINKVINRAHLFAVVWQGPETVDGRGASEAGEVRLELEVAGLQVRELAGEEVQPSVSLPA